MAATKIEVAHETAANLWDWPLEKNDGIVRIINTKDHFEVGLHVPQFTPNEIEVSLLFLNGQ